MNGVDCVLVLDNGSSDELMLGTMMFGNDGVWKRRCLGTMMLGNDDAVVDKWLLNGRRSGREETLKDQAGLARATPFSLLQRGTAISTPITRDMESNRKVQLSEL